VPVIATPPFHVDDQRRQLQKPRHAQIRVSVLPFYRAIQLRFNLKVRFTDHCNLVFNVGAGPQGREIHQTGPDWIIAAIARRQGATLICGCRYCR
jgi:hypothetical protein